MQKKRIGFLARVLCVVLCLFMAMAMFAGCKKSGGDADSSKNDSSQTTSYSAIEQIDQITVDPHLPETADLQDFELKVGLPAGAEAVLIPKEGESSEGDLMLKTLAGIQKKYNCKISVVTMSAWDEVMAEILAGGLPAHVLMPTVHQSGQFISARLVADYMKADINKYIHMDEPWWNSTMAYASNVKGKVYAGACNIQSMADMNFVVMFNKRILKEIGASEEEIYSHYTKKTWTWDVFRDYAKRATKDLDNDGVMTVDDQWGWTSPEYDTIAALLTSANCDDIITKDGKEPTFNYNTPFAISTLTKINDMFVMDMTRCPDSEKKTGGAWNFNVIFLAGRSLFEIYHLETIAGQNVRSMDDEIGIVPIPLGPSQDGGWQKQYRSRVDHNFRLCLIPATNLELSQTALVLEAISFNFWKIINKKTQIYGDMYLYDDTAAEVCNTILNYSEFEISQFIGSVNGNAYNNNVRARILAAGITPGYDVAGEFASVADLAQQIIDDYFADKQTEVSSAAQ